MAIERNVELWDSVCKTDPSHTKKFTKGGGFSGTAIKPFWLMRRATEVFGPCGLNWGWTEIENAYRAGIWCSKVRLWYILDGKRGEIEQWGQTLMEGSNKNGPFVDEEAPKKAVTDGVTKCLSYLGFAGDVHLGMFDDSKYVAELNRELHGGESSTSPAPEEASSDSPEAISAFKQKVAEAFAKQGLSAFQRKFIDDMHAKIQQYGNRVKLPSEKQAAILEEILTGSKRPAPQLVTQAQVQAIMDEPPAWHNEGYPS